jgi:type II secretory pathway pseudopilin PulG
MVGDVLRFRVLPLIIAFALVFVFIFILVRLAGSGADVVAEREQAIALAQETYAQQKADGVDFDSGPCLSEDLMKGWVADIVHSPRQPVDDLAENQCQAFREGRAFRIVELDPDGNVVRAQ